jgi:hypothetical protein
MELQVVEAMTAVSDSGVYWIRLEGVPCEW